MCSVGKTILESYGQNKQYAEELIFDIEHLKSTKAKYLNKFGNSDLINHELEQKSDTYRQVHTQLKIIENTINQLEQPSKNILYYKYVRHLPNTNIAIRMSYSEPRIYQLLNKAISEFEEQYALCKQQCSLPNDYSKL